MILKQISKCFYLIKVVHTRKIKDCCNLWKKYLANAKINELLHHRLILKRMVQTFSATENIVRRS